MSRLPYVLALALAAFAAPVSVGAQQQSEGYKFLQAVRDAKGNDVLEILNKPGSTIVNTRDRTNGEGALHIVVARGDETYLRFLLQKGADANMRDARGNTPMLIAVNKGFNALIPILIAAKAGPNIGNAAGETPLIRAVQNRDLATIRVLLANGADADQADIIAGMSARDYAARDSRNPAIGKLLAETPKKAPRAAVAGPKL